MSTLHYVAGPAAGALLWICTVHLWGWRDNNSLWDNRRLGHIGNIDLLPIAFLCVVVTLSIGVTTWAGVRLFA